MSVLPFSDNILIERSPITETKSGLQIAPGLQMQIAPGGTKKLMRGVVVVNNVPEHQVLSIGTIVYYLLDDAHILEHEGNKFDLLDIYKVHAYESREG